MAEKKENMSITCLLFFLDSERCSVRFFSSKNALSLTIAVGMGMCWWLASLIA